MKDSGIKWIGSIPDTWNVIKVKYNCSLKGRIGWQGLTTDEYIDEGPLLITGTDFNVNDGVINWDSCAHVSEWRYEQAPEIQVHNGDLLITKDGTIGKVAIVTNMMDKTTLNSGVMVIRPTEDNYETRFLYYVLKSEEFWKWFNYINSGNTTISHLYQHDLNHFYFAITDKTEQRAIIDFLDKKCQQADVVINKVKEQINLLSQARLSLITETVTKGVRQHSEFIETSVAWLNKIPKEWVVEKLKYVTVKIGSGKTPKGGSEIYEDEGILFIRSQNVYDNGLYLDDVKYINEVIHSEMSGTKLRKGDVLFNITGASIGRCCVYNLDVEANVNQHVCIIRMSEENYSPYIRYVFNSNIGKAQTAINQVGGTREGLSFEQIKCFYVPVPSYDEQVEISDYLDKKCSVIDRIIEKKQDELNILEEQKKSLINEYITGKKRVKGYA